MNNSKILVLMCGLPASGKSTFVRDLGTLILDYNMKLQPLSVIDPLANSVTSTTMMSPKHADYYDAVSISSDEFLDNLAEIHDITYEESFRRYSKIAENLFWAQLAEFVASDTSVIIVDRTHMNEKSRKRTIDAVNKVPYSGDWKVIVVEFRLPEPQRNAYAEKRKADTGKSISDNVVISMRNSKSLPELDTYIYDDVYTISNNTDYLQVLDLTFQYVKMYAKRKLHPTKGN